MITWFNPSRKLQFAWKRQQAEKTYLYGRLRCEMPESGMNSSFLLIFFLFLGLKLF